MIKKIFLSVSLCFLAVAGYCQTSSEWQADLRYLQQTIHLKYSNLFYNIAAADWDKATDVFHDQIPKLEKEQVLAGFIKLVALFHIGHTQMNTFGLHVGTTNLQLNRLPFELYSFSDGVYILRAANQYEKAVGGKVLKIGNMKIEDAIEAIRPLVSYENEQGFKGNCMFYLGTPQFLKTQGIINSIESVPISYSKNGVEETIDFTPGNNNAVFSMTGLETPAGWTVAQRPGNLPLWQKEPSAFRYMELIPGTKTLYVRHSVTLNDGNKTMAAFFNDMVDFIDKNEVEKLVLDLRTNGGGNNTLNKPVITGIIKSRKINQKGKFFCIIGRRTFSAAQNLVNELEKNTEVIFVGEPTSENVNFYGDTRTETLPNSKLQANLSWLWWQNMDPRDKRKATSPALAADMRFTDYYNNIDPIMNVITAYNKQGPIDDKLKSLVEQGKFDDAVSAAANYLKDPLHRYFKDELETKINTYGYTLINQNKFDNANKVLKMNIQLFPESANVYDSYAESFMLMGKKEEALKYYEMAIAKDKDGITAENAKKQIEKIRTGVN
jgi:predicted negative regulator of RcsB-dependent stress response